MSTRRRRGVSTPGYKTVQPTAQELTDYAASHNGRRPAVYRSEHTCGKRLWHSGLAVGAHGRVCSG